MHTSECVPSSTHCGYQSHTHPTPLHSKSKQGQPVQGFPWPLLLGRDAESSHTTIEYCYTLARPCRLVSALCLFSFSSLQIQFQSYCLHSPHSPHSPLTVSCTRCYYVINGIKDLKIYPHADSLILFSSLSAAALTSCSCAVHAEELKMKLIGVARTTERTMRCSTTLTLYLRLSTTNA